MNRVEPPGSMDDYVRLSFFVDIGKAIAAAKSMREVMERVMEHIGAIFAPLNWSLLLIDPSKDELVFKIVVGEAADKLLGYRVRVNEGITGWIYENGQAVIIADVHKDSRFSSRIDEMTGFRTTSIIGVPLRTDREVLGVIELVNKLDGSSFTPYELKVLSTIADFAAIALEKVFYIRALKAVSRNDYLTGVLNRRSLDLVLEREIERCKRHGQSLAALLVDIDDFKKINDSHGHSAGDKVLKEVGRILKESVRRIDYVARFGGDEFTVIMPSTTREEAEKVRQRIVDGVAEASARGPVRFTLSIGLHASGPEDVESIFEKTDIALYRQKQSELVPPLRMDEHLLEFYEEEP